MEKCVDGHNNAEARHYWYVESLSKDRLASPVNPVRQVDWTSMEEHVDENNTEDSKALCVCRTTEKRSTVVVS